LQAQSHKHIARIFGALGAVGHPLLDQQLRLLDKVLSQDLYRVVTTASRHKRWQALANPHLLTELRHQKSLKLRAHAERLQQGGTRLQLPRQGPRNKMDTEVTHELRPWHSQWLPLGCC
jgi:hypothetical protein